MTDIGKSQTMRNNRQWEMTDTGRLKDNWKVQTMGNGRQWGVTDSGEWQTMGE